jgi:hypothetical protein
MNFIFTKAKSDLPLNSSKQEWKEVKVDSESIRKVIICFEQASARLAGIQLFNAKGGLLIEAGRIDY